MARLVLTGTDGTTFEIRPNEMRTLDMTVTPVMDPSGMEVLYHKIKLDVVAIINPFMLATNQPTVSPAVIPPPGAPPPLGLTYATGPGDRSGLTARAITLLLANPRPLVQYWLGPDLTLEAPDRLNPGGTSYLPCDPMGGPFVRHCRCYEMCGDKTIFLNLSLELATTAYAKILLTNRWSMAADIDSAGFTTRIINGVATFRLDGMEETGFVPDDYRNLLLVPTDLTFRRSRATFTQEDDGQTYRYHVVDRETAYGTGAASGIEKIDGTITVHMGTQVPTAKKFATGAISTVTRFISRPLDTIAGLANTLVNVSTVDLRVSCALRVQGMNGTKMIGLYNTAIICFQVKVLQAIQRAGWKFALESITATQWIGSEDQPIVEIRATGVPIAPISVVAMLSGKTISEFMDLDTGINGTVVAGGVTFTPAIARTNLPNSNNTRGLYQSNIVAQALEATASDLPAAPAAPPIAVDLLFGV